MIYSNLLQAVGKTPIVKINSIEKENRAEILAKAEFLNIGGSIKTRTACAMIMEGKRQGLINEKSVIVEVSSGNQGIGLALVGAILSIKTIIIIPSSVSEERCKLLKLYGAEVIRVKDNGDIGDCIHRCERLANELKKENPNVFIPNQFNNFANPNAHYNTTALEILQDVGEKIDGLCLGIGSGGSISGIGRRLKEANPKIVIWAVEPEKAAILSGGKVETHIQMGIGDGIIPSVLDKEIIDKVIKVSDAAAVYYAKLLAKKEGIACGISSGSNIFGSLLLAKELGIGKRVVTIFPDGAERYFSTPLFL